MRAIHTDFKTVFIDSSCQIIVLRRCIAESGDFGIAPQIYSECFEPFRTPYCLYIFIKSFPHSLIRTGKTPLAYRHISQLNFSAIVCQRTLAEGTTVGYKRLVRFTECQPEKIRLTIRSARNEAHILRTGLFYARPLTDNSLLIKNFPHVVLWLYPPES